MNTQQQKTGGDGINPAPILKFTAIDDAEPLVVSGKGGEMTPTTLDWKNMLKDKLIDLRLTNSKGEDVGSYTDMLIDLFVVEHEKRVAQLLENTLFDIAEAGGFVLVDKSSKKEIEFNVTKSLTQKKEDR